MTIKKSNFAEQNDDKAVDSNSTGVNSDDPSPVVAAYIAGGLWNRLSWHMPQAWLSSNSHQVQSVFTTAAALGRVARFTRTSVDRTGLQNKLDELIRDWNDYRTPSHVADEIASANSELSALFQYSDSFQLQRDRICNGLLNQTKDSRVYGFRWEILSKSFADFAKKHKRIVEEALERTSRGSN